MISVVEGFGYCISLIGTFEEEITFKQMSCWVLNDKMETGHNLFPGERDKIKAVNYNSVSISDMLFCDIL